MEGINCPICKNPSQLLSTTNPLCYYCQHCDVRFDKDGYGQSQLVIDMWAESEREKINGT
jgi:hypothetical protein